MAKRYRITCRDAGVDCDFQAEGATVEEVMQIARTTRSASTA